MTTTTIHATFTNAVIRHQFGRILPAVGDARDLYHEERKITFTRVRGGCWSLTGNGSAALLKTAVRRIHNLESLVADRRDNKVVDDAYAQMEADFHARTTADVAKPVYTTIKTSTFRGLAVTVVKVVEAGKADRYLATGSGSGRPINCHGATGRAAEKALYKLLHTRKSPRRESRPESARHQGSAPFNNPFSGLKL